ncbi:MAG TPA: MlaD family protein [Solirubrobacteraceae bacterium]|nr:MlaD family protein [Solirubrobacteraceae bacterium]
MKRAIRAHRVDFIAILVLLVLAVLVTGYVLEHQPAFHVGQSYYEVNADFSEASAVTAGQGQAVTIAGVPIGQVGGVSLRNGVAVVRMDIEKRYAPIYRNATVLLRPRTPLKDMYLELDPGTRSAGRLPAGGTIPTSQTTPDVDVSQILSSLDSDSRNYLLLLLSAGAGAFRDGGSASGSSRPSPDAVSSLQETLKRFAPLDRSTRTFASLLARRQASLRRAVHNLNLVASSLGGVDRELASLIDASDTNFRAIAANDAQLRRTLGEFPGTLQVTRRSLVSLRSFASASRSALTGLQPFARHLAPALDASRPLFESTTSVLASELRPFTVRLQPLARTLRPAAASLKVATPRLTRSVAVLNGLFNELAYAPAGKRSYLFYGGWLAHIADSLVSSGDANGSVVQGLFMGTCAQLNFYENSLQQSDKPLGVILALLNAPPVAQLPGVKPLPGTTSYSCPTG